MNPAPVALSPTLIASLPILRCPLTRQSLSLLSAEEIAAANSALARGEWYHAASDSPPHLLSHALGTPGRTELYRIDEDICCLLPELALTRTRPAAAAPGLDREMRIVQRFYDEFGWTKSADGRYQDTELFTPSASVAERYRRRCNARLQCYLSSGEFLLDAASGAIPHPEYLAFSANYRTRICLDFSIRALREAREKLGGRGLYVLGDITRLPLADGAVDAVLSLHTLYHLPPSTQPTAVDELTRVARPGAPVLVVYTWSRAPLVSALDRLRTLPRALKRFFRPAPLPCRSDPNSSSDPSPPLYFHPCDQSWFFQHVASRQPVRLRVWSAISGEFQKRFLTDTPHGRLVASIVGAVERLFPYACGRWGQYPLWVLAGRGAPPDRTPSAVQ